MAKLFKGDRAIEALKKQADAANWPIERYEAAEDFLKEVLNSGSMVNRPESLGNDYVVVVSIAAAEMSTSIDEAELAIAQP